MNIPEILKVIGEQVNACVSGKLAFAEAISVADRLIIPVAWVRYDFGAGGGAPEVYRKLTQEAGGGGGGAQVSVAPAGMIEITPTRTRFIPLPDQQKMFALIASSFSTAGAQNREHSTSGPAKKSSRKEAGANTAYGRKAAGKGLTAAAKKATAKKAALTKTSRALSPKLVATKAAAKKKAAPATTRKSAAK